MIIVPDITPELSFRTSRSGGAGGQNVNKVETAVTGLWNPAESQLFTEEEKAVLVQKLFHRLDKQGLLSVRATTHRSQLENKQEVIEKMKALIGKALEPKKPRIASKPSRQSKEKRLDLKKQHSAKKQNRQNRYWPG